MSTLTTQDLELLAKYDTPTVCNVIELFDIKSRTKGFMDKSIVSAFPELPPMVGFAATATFRGSTTTEEPSYGSFEKQVASFDGLPGPAVVVFEDLDQPIVSATFGEIMCTIYQRFGAKGLITSGAGRDLDQVRVLDFPVFTNGTICSHGYSRFPSLSVPVKVGGLTIYPGDLIHGDCNGITTIPLEIAKDVARTCESYIAAEAIILDYLKGEKVTPQGLAEAQNECRGAIRQLAEGLK